MTIAALIPAFNPDHRLVEIVRGLADSEMAAIIVVNDGSNHESDPVFAELVTIDKVTVLQHAVNLGKGAALKTGLNRVYCSHPDCIGIVTLDADGQHLLKDVLSVANLLKANIEKLVVGVRAFDVEVPFRSRLGNNLTRNLFRLLIGQKLTDTQSGLRGIPRNFIPHLLKIDSNGYEFELDMLLACKYTDRVIIEQTIQTVYIDANRSSHFNPIVDSMKIYFVLFRFTLTSLLSAAIDNAVFILVFGLGASILVSQASARVLATAFNFSAVKKMVFYSGQRNSKTLPKYLLLVCFSGGVSYLLMKSIMTFFPLSVIASKITAELILFFVNFSVQRDYIFVRNKSL